MPSIYTVPDSVRAIAGQAVALQKAEPLRDVIGQALAERFATGEVTLGDIQKVHRFFAVNGRKIGLEEEFMRTAADSALVRSSDLHGGEPGKAWAAATVEAAKADGVISEIGDVDSLFARRPEEIYDLFQLGAWQFEYDMDVTKAARFAEHYMHATGFVLDLQKAFGESSAAVSSNLWRRVMPGDPFRMVAESASIQDTDIAFAANLDLHEMSESLVTDHLLDESLFPKIAQKNEVAAAKLAWAPFVAYFVLAVEAPHLIADHNSKSRKPPALDQKMKSYQAYNDTVNLAMMFFHPDGAKYEDPDGTKFAGIDAEIMDMVWKAWAGKKLTTSAVQKVLGKARRWTANNKMAGSQFHVFNADWKKANWQHILDNIPLDAEIRSAFEEFAKGNPMPKDGVKLQQSLANKQLKASVDDFISDAFGSGISAEQIKIGVTKSAAAAKDRETPIGVFSVIEVGGAKRTILAAYTPAGGGGEDVIVARMPNGNLISYDDSVLADGIDDGSVKVIMAHEDMPGSIYSQNHPEPDKVVPQAPKMTTDPINPNAEPKEGDAIDFATEIKGNGFLSSVSDPVASTVWTDPSNTSFAAETEATFGVPLAYNQEWTQETTHGVTGFSYYGAVAIAFEGGGTAYAHAFADIDGLVWLKDSICANLVGQGKLTPAYSSDIPEPTVGVDVDANAPSVADAPPTPQYAPGTVVEANGGARFLLSGFVAEHDSYVAQKLLKNISTPYLTLVGRALVEAYEQIATGVNTPTTAWRHAQDDGLDVEDPQHGFEVGDAVQYNGNEGVIVSGWKTPSMGVLNIMGRVTDAGFSSAPDAYSIRFELLPTSIKKVEVSYDPPAEAPESALAEDEADPEQGDFQKWGTPAALEFVNKKGWEPVAAGDAFSLPLGAVQAYQGKPGQTRTIVGFALKDGSPAYIIKTEKGNVNFVTAAKAHAKYKPNLSTDQETLNTAVPLPSDVAKQKFPKLNYKLTDLSKKTAQQNNLVFVPKPTTGTEPNFHVGTKITSPTNSYTGTLVGWIAGTGTQVASQAVITVNGEDYLTLSVGELNMWSIAYETPTLIDDVADKYDFSKKVGAVAITMYGPEGTFPNDPPEGWDEPDNVAQPALDGIPSDKHISAGVVVIFDKGLNITNDNGFASTKGPQVMLYKPLGGYGGYQTAIPKGTVDKGESLTKAAVREVFEETGVAVKAIAHLGDFKANTSVTRLFIGHAVGGNLQTKKTKDEEADAVVLRPLFDESWYDELVPKSGNPWQVDAVKAARKWFTANGAPYLNPVDQSQIDAAPTGPQDVPEPVAFDPNASIAVTPVGDIETSVPIDYPIDPLHHSAIAYKIDTTAKAWHLDKATPWLNFGYPPPGVSVKIPTMGLKGTEQKVVAYAVAEAETGESQIATMHTALPSGTVLHHPIQISVDNGATWSALLDASEILPATKTEAANEQVVPADTSADDVWKALLFKATFPINSKILANIKASAKDAKVVPVSYQTSKAAVTGEPYGTVWTVPGEGSLTNVGYVSLSPASGDTLHLAIFVSGAGAITLLPITAHADPAGSGMSPSSDQTVADAANDAWYQHPQAEVMEMMKAIYTNGGNVKSVGWTITNFKKACSVAGVPSWSVINKGLVQDVAGLFIPGVYSKVQHDIIIGALKARMQATKKGKKAKASTAQVDTVSTTAAPQSGTPSQTATITPPPLAPVVAVTASSFNSVGNKALANNPNPDLFTLDPSLGGLSGGSKPNQIIHGPNGKWLYKTASGSEKFRAVVDAAAYQLMEKVKKNNVPVGVLQKGELFGSIQPVIEDAAAPPANPDELSDDAKAELLSQHAYDMFAGDHDGHAGNWLFKNGQLIAIDRGQSFKFLLQGKKESLDPNWHAPGNFGSGYAKGLLIEWAKGNADIPDVAWAAFSKTISKVMALSDADLQTALLPVFTELETTAAKRKTILKKLGKRRDDYGKAWTDVLTAIRSDFQWVVPPKKGSPGASATQEVLTSSPSEQGITPDIESTIGEATAAGWQGKSVQIDRDAIESQTVMVRRVMQTTKSGEVEATMIHFRFTRDAGVAAAQFMFKNSEVVAESEDSTGPKRLAVDTQNNLWNKIETAIKSVNYHLFKQKDTAINESSIKAALGIMPVLQDLQSQTTDASGIYAPTGEPNEVVNIMAAQYVQYVEAVQFWWENKEDLVGKHSPEFAEFVWEPEPEKRREKAVAKKPAYKIKYKKGGALLPKTQADASGVKVSSLSHPTYNSTQQPQFVVTDKMMGAQVHINPPKGFTMGNAGSVGGIQGQVSQVWGIMPGAPSPQTVAHLLKLVESSTGLGMKAATPEDREALYWSQQANILQKGGAAKPKSDGTSVVEASYQKALQKYREGDTAGAIKDLKATVAKKMGVKVSELASQPGFNLDGEYTRGAGYNRNMRIGWDREKMVEALGASTRLAHRLLGASSVLDFFQKAQNVPALISNSTKGYYGITATGASPGSDFDSGGTQGLFCCLRKGFSSGDRMLYFDISIMLRLDVYMVGTGDTFGRVTETRYTTPEQWLAKGAIGTGTCGASSSYQINVRHDIDMQQYLVRAVCASATERDACIKLANDRGWTFANGAKPEDVFVAS